MNNLKYAKIILCAVILTVGLNHDRAQSQPPKPKSKLTSTLDIGRTNPFAKISRPKKSIPQNISRISETYQEKPELFLETITLNFLNAEDLRSAIEAMCSEYGSVSADAKSNSLIICDTKANIERIIEEVKKADVTPQQTLFVETVSLKFLEADNLKTALQNMSSQYGTITTNKETNSLIICDTKENLDRILAEIKKCDRTPQQIMVEVVILDVQLKDDTEIGINWDLLSDKTYDIGYRQNFTTSRLGSTIESSATIGNATAFNTTGLGGSFSVISGTVRNVIHLIQQKKDVEILASPRAMMVSGQSANIQAVEEIPYEQVSDTSEGGAGALTSTEFKEVGINLQVTATITDDNDIFLTVTTEQNVKTSQSVGGVPVVDTRRANTSLLLADGQLVIMGGLRRQEKTREVDQIPILGDLPIVGELFKSTNTVINNSELIVLISPHLYKKEEPIPDQAMAKYNEIKNRPILSLPDAKEKKNSPNSSAGR